MGMDMGALRGRIKSVDSIRHLTHAMGLVASSKIRKAQQVMYRGREYAAAVRAAIAPLTRSGASAASGYRSGRPGARRCLVVIAADRGLAGGYHANVLRAVRDDKDVEVIAIGKRACEHFGQPSISAQAWEHSAALGLAADLCRDFTQGMYGSVEIVCTRYVSMLVQQVSILPVLPLLPMGDDVAAGEILFEPSEESALAAAVPEYVAGVLTAAVRESVACEIAARRNAMDAADKNARALLDELRLEYNRVRQGAITQEISEIVAGGETSFFVP